MKSIHTHTRDLISVILIDDLILILKLYVPYAAKLRITDIQILKPVLDIGYAFYFAFQCQLGINIMKKILHSEIQKHIIFACWTTTAHLWQSFSCGLSLPWILWDMSRIVMSHLSRLLNLLANYTLSIDKCWKWINALQIHNIYLKLLLRLQSSE